MDTIVAALIAGIASIIVALIGKKRKPSKMKFWIWWTINITLGIVLIAIVVFIFWPKWNTVDSGNYHLGDNLFRLDQTQRPQFQSPGGTNVDNLILWDKDTGEYQASSSYTMYIDPGQWKDLHLEKYDELLGGTYYLGKVVIGYIKTFDLQDIKSNNIRIFPLKSLYVTFDVFDLSSGATGGQLIFILNQGEVEIPVISTCPSQSYTWCEIEPIEIPVNMLNANINVIQMVVTPKYTYNDEGKFFHFEDVEIRDLRLKLSN